MINIDSIKKECSLRGGKCVWTEWTEDSANKKLCNLYYIDGFPMCCPFVEYKDGKEIKPCDEGWSGMSYIRWLSENKDQQ